MKFGFVVFFLFVVLLLVGMYYSFAPVQNVVGKIDNQQNGLMSTILNGAPGFIEYLNDRFRLLAVLVIFLSLAISFALGRSETHGFVTLVVYAALAVCVYYAGLNIGNLPEPIYALKLCLGAWSLPFALVTFMFSGPGKSASAQSA